jgi:PA14 domain
MLCTSQLQALSLVFLGLAAVGCVDASDEGDFSTPADVAGIELPAGRLCGRVYDVPRDTRRLPDFESLRPFEMLCTDRLDVPWRKGFPGFPGVRGRYEWFGIDFRGVLDVREPGLFSFRLSSDDGSRLFVDDALVVDNDGYHDVRTVTGAVALTAGQHRIRVAFWQGPGPLALILEVARPGEGYQVFRADRPLVGEGEGLVAPVPALP